MVDASEHRYEVLLATGAVLKALSIDTYEGVLHVWVNPRNAYILDGRLHTFGPADAALSPAAWIAYRATA